MDVPQIPTSKQNRGIVARRPFQGGTQIQERIIETHKIIDVPIIHPYKSQAAYNSNFTPESSVLSAKNTYFWNVN
jgi:hypothetical protein